MSISADTITQCNQKRKQSNQINTKQYTIKMSRLLEQCLLLAMSDISDEELWDSSDESDTEHILLQLAGEFVAAEERNSRPFGEKRIARFNDHQFVQHLGVSKELAFSLSEKFENSLNYQTIKGKMLLS